MLSCPVFIKVTGKVKSSFSNIVKLKLFFENLKLFFKVISEVSDVKTYTGILYSVESEVKVNIVNSDLVISETEKLNVLVPSDISIWEDSDKKSVAMDKDFIELIFMLKSLSVIIKPGLILKEDMFPFTLKSNSKSSVFSCPTSK